MVDNDKTEGAAQRRLKKRESNGMAHNADDSAGISKKKTMTQNGEIVIFPRHSINGGEGGGCIDGIDERETKELHRWHRTDIE